MQQKLVIRLLGSASLVALLALASPAPGFAEDVATPAATEDSTPFDASQIDTFSGAVLAANTADNDKDYASAIALYKIALAFEPNNLELQEKLMFAEFLSGDFDSGAEIAEMLKSDPAMERVTVIARGLQAVKKGDYASAQTILKYDGQNDLDLLMNSLVSAWAMVGEGKGKEAVAAVQKLGGPEWFALFKNYNVGAMAAINGDIDTARKALNAAVTDRDGGATAQDTYLRSIFALARLEAAAGNKQKALDAVAKGEEAIGNYSPFKALRASIDKGEPQVQQITDAKQGAGSVMFSVAGALNQSLSSMGRGGDEGQDLVIFYLQTALALDPTSADTLMMLGDLVSKSGRPEQAIELYKKVPETSPMRRLSELQLGLDLADTGKKDEAKLHFEKLIATDPQDMRNYLALGSVYSQQEDYKAMAATYDKAVENMGTVPNRSLWTIFYQRGIAYERLKQWDKAEPNFVKALELNPDQPQVLNYLGYSWIDMNIKLDEGMAMIRKAVDLRPDDGYIVDSLGWAYFKTGKFAEAVTELERAVELKENDPTLNDHLGDAYWRVGRKLEAGFQWNRALLAKPEPVEVEKIKLKLEKGLPDLPPVQKAEAKLATETATDAAATAETKVAEEAKPVEPAVTPDATKVETTPAVTPVTEAKPADAATASQHVVVQGDSLWKIAQKVLGAGARYLEILAVNPDLKNNPDRLKLGQTVVLPPEAK